MSTEDEFEEDLTGGTDDENVSEETGGSSDADKIQDLMDKVAELANDRLRMAAEMQNTRKRLVKQQQEDYKYRHQDILRDLAEVIDNFERAIQASEESGDFHAFHEGIEMIEKQFTGMLTEKYNLERFGEIGEAFDPGFHEAMMMEESPDTDGEVIKQVYQSGYRLHNRIIRPAKVVVSKSAPLGDSMDNEDDQKNDQTGVK